MARPDMGGGKMGGGFGSRFGGGGGFGGGGRDRDRDRERDGERGGEEGGRRGFGRRKVCRFCADKNLKLDYKDQNQMKYFLTERGKIIPRRISGNCAKHQREVATAIKRGRMLAILPYTVGQM
jgi:small subunit ribosomal protein S18